MNFLRQRFRKSSSDGRTDGQTDTTEIIYHAASRVVKYGRGPLSETGSSNAQPRIDISHRNFGMQIDLAIPKRVSSCSDLIQS